MTQLHDLTTGREESLYATAADYHSDCSRVSSTMLKTFRQSRPLYEALYVTRTMQPKEPTDAMRRGTLVHLLTLEPEQWDSVVAPPAPELAPNGKKWYRRQGSDHARWWQEYLDSCDGKIPLTAEQYGQVKAMVAALEAHDAGRYFREPGPTEHVIHWTDEETGLECKSRRDKWIQARNWVLDIKTCQSVDYQPFSCHCERMGYFHQAAFYLAGHHEWYGYPGEFLWIAVEAEYPHPVAIHRVPEGDIASAHAENLKAMRDLADCLQSGDWRKQPSKQINDLSRPPWAVINQQQWEPDA